MSIMATAFQKDFSNYAFDYFALLCLQLVGVWGIFWFNYNPNIQFLSIIYMAISYITWGILHHSRTKDLHIKIVVEYILFAIIAVLLLGVLIIKP